MRKQTLINKICDQLISNVRGKDRMVSLGSKLWPVCGLASLVGLVGISLLAVCPRSSSESAHAAISGNVNINVKSASNLSVSLDSSIAMELSPGETQASSANLTIQTNNPTGYNIYLQTGNGSNSLKPSDTATSDVISSLTASTIGTNMTGNTWGYALATTAISTSSTFSPIPSTQTKIGGESSAAASGQTKTYNLGIGVHIDTSLPAGTYSNTLTISVVANSF